MEEKHDQILLGEEFVDSTSTRNNWVDSSKQEIRRGFLIAITEVVDLSNSDKLANLRDLIASSEGFLTLIIFDIY